MHWHEVRRFFAVYVLLLCAGTKCSFGVTSDDPSLKSLLLRGIQRGYPGVAVLTQSHDGKTRSAAAGYSDLEHRTPMRVDDAFHMASINKTFTAVTVLRLVDDNRLSLQATLKECLGDTVTQIPNADHITVAQLLDHSSGIYPTNNDMDYLTTVIGPNADPLRVWTPQQLIALADKNRSKPSGEPGKGHYYSDTNYVLLGMIVERISGHPFKQHVTETLLTPLGMNSTYFYSSYLGKNAHAPASTVQGYLLATEELRSNIRVNTMFKPVPGNERAGGQLLNTTLAAERRAISFFVDENAVGFSNGLHGPNTLFAHRLRVHAFTVGHQECLGFGRQQLASEQSGCVLQQVGKSRDEPASGVDLSSLLRRARPGCRIWSVLSLFGPCIIVTGPLRP
jgi:CubicO group peptidase (beta-lactamase class C family)